MRRLRGTLSLGSWYYQTSVMNKTTNEEWLSKTPNDVEAKFTEVLILN